MNFNHYFTNEEIEEKLNEWAQKFPKIARMVKIGESYEKRPILMLVVTNQETGADTTKPAVWLNGNIHASEITGATVMMRIIHTLLEGYGKDEQITRQLDQSVYYLTPRVNPDGAALAMAEHPRYVRSSVRKYPYPDPDDGLHVEDINKDGHILQMRIKDPNGDWKVSRLDPRLMEKRAPNEQGDVYYRLLPEGRIENYDGYIIKNAKLLQNMDFNRNFPAGWRVEGLQSGAGPYPVSEPETRAMVDFIISHPNINMAIGYHTFCRAILRPFAMKPDDEMETHDLWVYKAVGDIGTQITGYRNVSVFHEFKYHPKQVISGDFDDWLYEHLGIFSYTIELWGLPDASGIKDPKYIQWDRDHPHEEDLQMLQWLEANTQARGYYDWVEYDHPQLGKVELGGWDTMFTWRNPPLEYVGAEAETQVPFAITLGDLIPKISIHTLELKNVGGGTYHLNLVVENSGFLPTYTSAQAQKVKAARPVRLELDLPAGVELLTGKERLELGHLEGRSNKLEKDSALQFSNSVTDNRARCEWVLKGKPGTEITLKVLSERAGSIERKLVLPN